MATELLSLLFRGPRRVRLIFTGALASGAFTSTSLYAFENIDGLGFSPTSIDAVFAVVNTPNAVELAIDRDLVPGAQYQATCTDVPCADATLFSGSLGGDVGLVVATPVDAEPAQDDLPLLLYGRDLLHDGTDFVEDATGDLATVSGRENYRGAMSRRMTSNGLPWDDSYGPKIEDYVDAPETQAVPLQGALLAQARADDRTKKAAVTIVEDPNDQGTWAFEVVLTARDGLDPVTVTVPNPSGP